MASLAEVGGPGALFIALAFVASRWSSARSAAARPMTLGPYTLGEKLGEGGMGVVYQARHALLPRPAAVKLMKPGHACKDAVKRFEREVLLTSLLTHPNTVSVYDFGRTSSGTFYYAMEYLDGLDLQRLVERDGPQDPVRVAHILAQLCGALAEAHGIGLIHRDVKPANVMLCQRGGVQDVIKVVDFGLSLELERRSDDVSHSEVRGIVGTPLYLSPEALTAPETIDGRSDLYAVGAVGYFLLTGVPPFSGGGLLQVCAQHLHSAPVPPSVRLGAPIPPALEALILSCLEKSADRRPSSAALLQAALLPLAAEWTLL
jgi:serine/threonine protein kinase